MSTLALVLHVLLAAAVAWPQAKVDLSGQWVFVEHRPARPEGPLPNFGQDVEFRQTADALTVTRPAGTDKQSQIYRLDGSETEIRLPQLVTKTRARVEGGKLVMDVVTTPTAAGREPTVSTRRLWIDGDVLISEWQIHSPRASTNVSVYRRARAAASSSTAPIDQKRQATPARTGKRTAK